jgi:hypothetical protein
MTHNLFILLLVFTSLLSCHTKSQDEEIKYPLDTKDYFFIEQSGKTYFIFRNEHDPSEWSDDETSEYVTFEIDARQKGFYKADKNLRSINCMNYYTQFLLPDLDTTNAFIKKGILYGNKINDSTWRVFVQLRLTDTTISFNNLFVLRKSKLLKMSDGRLQNF